jgi:hypothetical protein
MLGGAGLAAYVAASGLSFVCAELAPLLNALIALFYVFP